MSCGHFQPHDIGRDPQLRIVTYARDLLTQPQLAFAVGADDDACRSYRPDGKGGWALWVMQHRAARNEVPPPACDMAVEDHCAPLMADEARTAMTQVDHASVMRLHTLQRAALLAANVAPSRAKAARRQAQAQPRGSRSCCRRRGFCSASA